MWSSQQGVKLRRNIIGWNITKLPQNLSSCYWGFSVNNNQLQQPSSIEKTLCENCEVGGIPFSRWYFWRYNLFHSKHKYWLLFAVTFWAAPPPVAHSYLLICYNDTESIEQASTGTGNWMGKAEHKLGEGRLVAFPTREMVGRYFHTSPHDWDGCLHTCDCGEALPLYLPQASNTEMEED